MKPQIENQAKYRLRKINSILALSKALGVSEILLNETSAKANNSYRKAKPIIKPDGSIRQPFDALPHLKEIHRKIKNSILKQISFPKYLTGCIIGMDYKVNASYHQGSKIIICEDIEGFFPSTSTERIFDIWNNFFCFSEEVSNLLTKLCTKDGYLPQGAIPSSYLANLAFWQHEPVLFEKLSRINICYSRFVDDITISSKQYLSNETKTHVIAQIYGMLKAHGYRAKRCKHEIFTDNRRMITTKLIANKKPSLPFSERNNIRCAVFLIERKINSGQINPKTINDLNTILSRVGRLGRFHPNSALKLKNRLKPLKELISKSKIITGENKSILIHADTPWL